MFDATRDHIATYLAARRLCVIGAGGAAGVSLLPVPCRAHGLALDCLLPLWADVTFQLEQDPRVTVAVPPDGGDDGNWLQIRGVATPLGDPDWGLLLPEPPVLAAPADLYRLVRVHPRRIDLLDRRTWCPRETLELEGDQHWGS